MRPILLASFLSFFIGFFAAKGLDHLSPILSNMDAIQGTVSHRLNVEPRESSVRTGNGENEAGGDSSEAVATVTSAAETAAPQLVEKLAEAAPPAVERLQETDATGSTYYFDKIVATAYSKATQPTPLTRNTFDIDFWERKSGLTTEGGLQRADRILLSKLYSNASSVFEYGLGESTYMANYVGVPRYAGIDSDPVWVDMARQKVSQDYRFYFADIGKTGVWGYPKTKGLMKNILDYQLEPLMVEQKPFDVYMVDGRYRLACALACFLHARARGADPTQTTVLIHDCQTTSEGGRSVYKAADHLLHMVNHSGDRLCVYQRRPETTDEQLMEIWHKYAGEVQRR